MGNVLCGDGFAKFMEIVTEHEVGLEKLEDLIGDALVYVRDELHLGKAAMIMEVLPTIYQPHGRTICHDFYTYEAGYGSEHMLESYATGDKATLKLYFHPEIGYAWQEDEKQAIRTLARYIYVIMRRARLKELVERATMTDSMTLVANNQGMKRFMKQVDEQNKLSLYNCAFMNIKNFRYYNQQVGSGQGDELLRLYAVQINDFLLPDESVSRMGGDNFIVFIKKERVNAFIEHMKKVVIEMWVNHKPLVLA